MSDLPSSKPKQRNSKKFLLLLGYFLRSQLIMGLFASCLEPKYVSSFYDLTDLKQTRKDKGGPLEGARGEQPARQQLRLMQRLPKQLGESARKVRVFRTCLTND